MAALLLSGCENTVEPYSRRAEPFSVYGALSLHDSDHFVRVKPLQVPFQSRSHDSLSASVTLTDMSTGTSYTLQDSIIEFGDGVPTHNFWTNVDLKPRTEYKLTVRGPAGRITEGTTLTPTDRAANIVPDRHTPGAPRDTIERGSDALDCLSRFRVEFSDARAVWSASVGVVYKGEPYWIPYTVQLREGPDGDDEFDFQVKKALNRIDPGNYDDPRTCLYRETQCRYLNSGRIRIAYTYLGPNWFGNFPADSARLGFDPTSAGQLDNGLGFFGSFRRDTIDVAVHRGVIELHPFACKGA